LERAVKHAIIVAGHAVARNPADPLRDESWALLPYQRGEPSAYVEHVRRGVELAAADPSALLLFSGGQSRADAGPRSEAQGYYAIAEHLDWFGHPGVRATTEEFARDSFENLLCGICRFREFTGAYPGFATIVGWRFKTSRFDLHREAIGWPRDKLRYEGVNDPERLDQALAAERANTARYIADPYSSGAFFTVKRAERNPFHRQHGYQTSCPEVAALFHHHGPEQFIGPLPWR
jgi:hypothetical protein